MFLIQFYAVLLVNNISKRFFFNLKVMFMYCKYFGQKDENHNGHPLWNKRTSENWAYGHFHFKTWHFSIKSHFRSRLMYTQVLSYSLNLPAAKYIFNPTVMRAFCSFRLFSWPTIKLNRFKMRMSAWIFHEPHEPCRKKISALWSVLVSTIYW